MFFVRYIALLAVAWSVVSCSRDPKKVRQQYLESGNRYYDRGKYPNASIMYRNAIRTDPTFGQAYYRLALTELKQQRVVNAVPWLQRAMGLLPKDSPDYIDANIKYAEIMLLAAQDERNTKALDEVTGIKDMLLKRDPKSFEGTKLLGELQLNDAVLLARKNRQVEAKAKLQEAISTYQTALSYRPGDTSTMLALAKSLTLAGQTDAAEHIYRQVIDKDKTLLAAYDELYRLYIAKRKIPEAEKILHEAIKAHPTDYDHQVLLAFHYFSTNNRPEMTKVLNGLKSHYKDYPEAFMKAGDFYLRIGDADQAVRQYQEGMNADRSRKVDYQKRIIEVLIRQGKTTEAYEKNLEILKANPKDPEARGLKASFLLDKGDVDTAITELQSVVTAKPDNFVARFNLGRAYFAKGELDQARQQFESALKLRSDYMPARLALTQLAIRTGDADLGLKLAQETLKMNPGSGITTLLEAAAYLRKGQYDESRRLLEAILKVNPNQADTLLEMGVLNLIQKRYKEAEEPFRKAYSVDPSNVRGLLGLAEIRFLQHEPDKGVQVVAEEVQKQPQRADLKKELANVESRAGMFDRAIQDYQSILDRYKDSPIDQADVLARMGVTYAARGDLQKGIEHLQKARHLVPSNVNYIVQLAQYYDTLGMSNDAMKTYQEARKIDPNDGRVLNNLAYLITSSGGNLDEALTLAQHAKQQLPNSDEVSDTIGWIYIKKNLNDSAIEIFKGLTVKAKNNPTFHVHYGMALAQKGDKANALREFKEALLYKPQKAEEDQIRQLIQKLS